MSHPSGQPCRGSKGEANVCALGADAAQCRQGQGASAPSALHAGPAPALRLPVGPCSWRCRSPAPCPPKSCLSACMFWAPSVAPDLVSTDTHKKTRVIPVKQKNFFPGLKDIASLCNMCSLSCVRNLGISHAGLELCQVLTTNKPPPEAHCTALAAHAIHMNVVSRLKLPAERGAPPALRKPHLNMAESRLTRVWG